MPPIMPIFFVWNKSRLCNLIEFWPMRLGGLPLFDNMIFILIIIKALHDYYKNYKKDE